MATERRQRLRGVATIADRPPRIGKLKIGEVKTNAKGVEYPSRLDYIIAKDGAGNRIESFHTVYGEKPMSFLAVFPSNDPTDWYWEAYRRYGSGTGLACHGDGRQAIVEETGETIDCPCQCADGERPTCKPMVSLSLFLYEVPELGVFQIDTGSINSLRNLRWFIETMPQLTGGQFTGVPIRVYIEPQQVVHDGHASTMYIWHLGLLPGYTPQNLHVAAEQAVSAFLVPPQVAEGRLLDEGKPEDLCLPAAPEVVEDPETRTVAAEPTEPALPTEWAAQVIGAETAFDFALDAAGMPLAKVDASRALKDGKRAQAVDSGNFEGYINWLSRQTNTLEAKAREAAGQGALV